MLNSISRVKHSVLFVAFTLAHSALRFAADAGTAETAPIAAPGNAPATAVKTSATKQMIQPTLDVDGMSEAEVKETLKRMLASQGTSRSVSRSLRFNDG